MRLPKTCSFPSSARITYSVRIDEREPLELSSAELTQRRHKPVLSMQKALGRPEPQYECDRRDYDVTAAVIGGHCDIVPFDKLTGRAALSVASRHPEPGTYDPSYVSVLPHVPAASLALRGREESASSGKRWEGNVLELNPDYDAVKPSVPSATISAFVLSAKTASGAVCCDDVPGVRS